MDRDDFIIFVYCLVCELYAAVTQGVRLRQRGPSPKLTDEEVITIEICGEYFGFDDDKAIVAYFRQHYSDWFPALTDRTTFVRQAANLWRVKALIQQQIVRLSGQRADNCQIIDTAPLPVCAYVRSGRDKCFKPWADFGYCAAKKLHYYGFKLGLRIARSGMITHFALLPARPHDIQLLDDLLEGFQGETILADKGFIDDYRQSLLQQRRGIQLITDVRKNMAPSPLPKRLQQTFRRWRKKIETVISQLADRFQIERIRVRDLWHFQNRLIRKILAHTMCVYLNLLLGRPPLDLSGLISP